VEESGIIERGGGGRERGREGGRKEEGQTTGRSGVSDDM